MVKLPKWFVLLIFLTCWPAATFAQPMFTAKDGGGAVVTFFNDECELKGEVTNLPYKATWTEKGKVFQGCWGLSGDKSQFMGYFDDKSVVAVPVQMLERVTGV